MASVFLLPLYTRHLTPADYGVMDLLDQAGNFLAILFGGNFSGAMFYFFFQKEDQQSRNRAAATNILGCLLAGALFAVFGVLFAVPISNLVFQSAAMATYFRILFVTMGLTFALEAVKSWLRAENKPHLFTATALVRLALVVVCSAVLLVVFSLGVRGILLSNLIVTAVATPVLLFYALRRVGLRFDGPLFGRMVAFAIPLALSGVALFVMHFADRFVLQRYVSLSDLGQYSVGYKIGMLMAFIHSSFHQYWSAQAYQLLRRPNAEVLLSRIFTYMMVILAFCGLGLVAVTKPVLALLANSDYGKAALVVPIIVFAYYLRAAGDFFRVLFSVHKKTSWDAACNWSGALVCMACYLVLIPRYGAWGAAVATAITFFVVLLVAFAMARQLMPLPLEFDRLAKLGALALALGVIPVKLANAPLASQITGAFAVALLYPSVLWLTGFFSAEDALHGKRLWRMARQRAVPSEALAESKPVL